MSFKSKNTYLAKANGKWYIVQQISMKGWVATLFTHGDADSFEADRHFKGNGVSLWNELKSLASDEDDFFVYQTRNTIDMRQKMFNVLKYGGIE